MAQGHYKLSQAEIDALYDRLRYLKGTRRSEILEKMADARKPGDLSDSEEYDRWRCEQAKLEEEIERLDRKLTFVLRATLNPNSNHTV